MASKKYYFSHDVNASQDPKIQAMMTVYGAEGYGWFWMLLEMMHDEDGYKLKLKGKYVFNALARKLFTDPERIKQYIVDCIHEFELFVSDGEYFFSKSFIDRMQKRDSKIEKAKSSAEKRWSKNKAMRTHTKSDANALRSHTRNANSHFTHANALKNDANLQKSDAINKRKGNKRKENNIYIYGFEDFLENGAEEWIKKKVKSASLATHKKYNACIIDASKIKEPDIPWGLIYTFPNSEKFYYMTSDGRQDYNP